MKLINFFLVKKHTNFFIFRTTEDAFFTAFYGLDTEPEPEPEPEPGQEPYLVKTRNRNRKRKK
jgi:hypothetical protein